MKTKTLELSGLEYQVDHLLRALEQAKSDNQNLRQKVAAHSRERSVLIEKNHHAAKKIKKIISQLKDEQHES